MIKSYLPPADLSKETPLMRQYWDIKSAHQDKILFFRMGDFFEMFFEDAVKAAPLIGIALTSRNKKGGDETPMCGIPHHSVANHINKLLSLGHKVAICDQIEDPKLAKGIVKRAVTRVLTPGMVFDSETLERNSSHYMAALQEEAGVCAIAFVEPTTGESFYMQNLKPVEAGRLLAVMPVAELVVAEGFTSEKLKTLGIDWQKTLSHFNELSAHLNLPLVARRLVAYVQLLGGEEALKVLGEFESRELQARLEMGPMSIRHLEIFQNYKGEAQGSLFKAINRTMSAPGARLLKQWLAFPLRQLSDISRRQQRVQTWLQVPGELKALRQALGELGDIERRLSRLATPQANARDLIAVAQAGQIACHLYSATQRVESQLQELTALRLILQQAEKTLFTFKEDAPISTRQGHMVNPGVSGDLDEYIRLTQDSQGLLAEMEAREKAATGISSLKIRYNNVFGYYIEITNTHKEKAPAHYQRKQTLANAERYCTEELIELEKKVLTAQAKRADLEYAIFEEFRKAWLKMTPELLQLAKSVAEVDVISSFAWLALERKYVRPEFNSEGVITLKASRHPSVEQDVATTFIANDITLKKGGTMLITGPNMAGKSTLMRQVACCVILAQVGSFIPAEQASLPLFDRLFTRIGASDQLSEGLSTFMVEMQETAMLLKESTVDSLVIVDEVGRGTSTLDGLSLAQAILEHLTTQIRCTSLFATHYHELTQLEGSLPGVQNYHLAVSESGGEIRFLHSLVSGPAAKSYGVYVAELAGLPAEVTRRAKGLLRQLESQKTKLTNQLELLDMVPAETQLSTEKEQLLTELKQLSVTQMTPIEALNKLASLQTRLLN